MSLEFDTACGRVRGAVDGRTIRISRLRYAAPPVGTRRFQSPQPPASWDGVHDAGGSTAMAPQWPARLGVVMGDYPTEQSEDCLHLDLWIPANQFQLLPVLVFFHGGAFISGGGGMPCYNGSLLAARGEMIVVNVSYRLGVLGFLPVNDETPANLGLQDQVAALHFIRTEIANFGGNPDRIAIAGQSAGAFSVAVLLSRDDSKELFSGAILLSAPLALDLQRREDVGEIAAEFLAALELDPSDRDGLHNVPVQRILEAQRKVLIASVAKLPPDDIGLIFKPIIDDDLIADRTLKPNRTSGSIPILLGSARDEFGAFWYGRSDLETMAESLVADCFERYFPGRGPAEMTAYASRRDRPTPLSLLADLHTDCDFANPSLAFLARHTEAGGHGFAYRFDWQAPNSTVGACHCIELPFIFGNFETWRDALMIAGTDEATFMSKSAVVQRAIIDFVHTGSPASDTGLEWPPFSGSKSVLHFE